VSTFSHSAGHLGQHPHDVLLDLQDVGLDLFQWTRRGVALEVTIEVDLVADEAHLAILLVAPGLVDPGVRHMGLHLAIEERFDALVERNALGVAKLRIGLGVAILVAADGGRLIALLSWGQIWKINLTHRLSS